MPSSLKQIGGRARVEISQKVFVVPQDMLDRKLNPTLA